MIEIDHVERLREFSGHLRADKTTANVADSIDGVLAQLDQAPSTLTFVQGTDWVWIELNGKKVWEESGWDSLGQFVRFSLPEGPVVLAFRESEEDGS